MILTGAVAMGVNPVVIPMVPLTDSTVTDTAGVRAAYISDPGRVELPRVETDGSRIWSFGLDWFDRIHINYTELALGNLIGEQIRQVRIWNAYQQAKRLDSIGTVGTEGLLLYGQPSPPMYFAAQEQKTWNLRVSTSGPPVINATYTFTFNDGTVRRLHVTGTRITAWATLPSWERPIVQRVEWLTDVLRARSGHEQRRQLRIEPRGTLEFDIVATDRERRLMEATIFGWGGRVWALPMWHDGTELPAALAPGTTVIPIDPTGLDFHASGIAMFIRDNRHFEIVEILSVQTGSITLVRPTEQSWPQGQVLYPARTARLDSPPKLTSFDSNTSFGSITFAIDEPINHEELTAAYTYRGWPVLTEVPNYTNAPSITYDRTLETLDGSTGPVIVNDPSGLPETVRSHTWMLVDRADRRAVFGLLYGLRGRQRSIWVPTFTDDLIVAGQIAANASSIDIEHTAYTEQYAVAVGRRDIMIVLNDGSILFRRIVQTQVVDDSTERLSIDTPLGRLVLPEQVLQISFMALSRNDADALELSHWTGETSELTVNFRGFNNDD